MAHTDTLDAQYTRQAAMNRLFDAANRLESAGRSVPTRLYVILNEDIVKYADQVASTTREILEIIAKQPADSDG